MTALEVIEQAAALGIKLALVDGEIEYRGRPAAIETIMPELRANASTVAALLRRSRPVSRAADAVIAAQTLLRECRWALELGPCAFFTGVPGSLCRRCELSWVEHLSIKQAK